MSEKPNDGGPAFPSRAIPNATDHRCETRDGMSLRDWFAGKALQGLCSNPSMLDTITPSTIAWLKKYSLEIANEMIKERNKQ